MLKKKEMTSNQILLINMIASALTYIVTFSISFFLSPYIVNTVGVEAYGFVSLANNFVNYASLAAVALNALSGRFITIKIYEEDYDDANRYYSSVFIANCLISLIILIAETVILINLDSLINIPANILGDIKLLFGTLFMNCVLSTIGSVFSVATFATNKLYITSLRTIESQILRAIGLATAFMLFVPHVWYLGAASLLTGVYCIFFNIHYMHVLLPKLVIKKKYFDIKAVIELLSSGVWSLINRVGIILLDGLDLLITNLFIDPTAMGVLSLAKTLPSIIQGIIGNLAAVFSPNLTILYAQGKKDELLTFLKQSMKIMGVLTNLPIIILAVCGEDFFHLWQPTQDSRQLQILSLLTISGFIVNGGINCIYNVFTVVNKLKVNSLAILITGGISAFITYLLVKNTNLGIFAVAGTSTVITILRNLIISIPYAAKCLDLKWYTFFPDVVRPVLYFCISVVACTFLTFSLSADRWILLIVKGAICGIVSLGIGFFIILNGNDRKILLSKIKRK